MKLYLYQEEYLSKLPPSCIMAADLGTGKTLMSLAHWERQNTGRPLLIVAPAAKIRTMDWQHEAIRWFDGSYIDHRDGTLRLEHDYIEDDGTTQSDYTQNITFIALS